MLELEAKTKWCPFTRAGINRVKDPLTECIGSDCMMWVCAPYKVTTSNPYKIQPHEPGYVPHGDCGLKK